MTRFLVLLRCPCCNSELEEFELERYDEFGGMKEECYAESIKAAYENQEDLMSQSLEDFLRGI